MLPDSLGPGGAGAGGGVPAPPRRRVELPRRIGVVFGQRTQLWWDLPLADSFELLKHVYRIKPARHAENLERFIELLDLGPFLQTPVRQLSLGQRMRGDLTAALLHDPEILYLDEPTIGLDVVSKVHVREFLADLNRDRGVTVLLTTHDLDDIERLCHRILVIDHGRVIYDGGVDALKERVGGERTLIVDLEAPAPPLVVRGAVVERVEGPRQWLRFRRSETSAAALVAEAARRARLVDLAIVEPDIEDVVRRIYTRGQQLAP